VDTLTCDTCGIAAATFARGWRAYVVELGDDFRIVYVACPDCTELYGEDEVHFADGSTAE
jgi:hypothetical protein